jgi:hypothetical protein
MAEALALAAAHDRRVVSMKAFIRSRISSIDPERISSWSVMSVPLRVPDSGASNSCSRVEDAGR